MAKPPVAPPKLPKDVALELAIIARVPPDEHDQFCELLQGSVQSVWELDRRATSTDPGQALIDAAQAARTLHKALGNLNKKDREWLQNILSSNPWYIRNLRELPLSVWRLAHLFSTAIGKSPPEGPAGPLLPKKPGSRQRTAKYPTFENLLTHLYIDVAETGGEVTFTKTGPTGTLIEVLDILGQYLPEGVVPTTLPVDIVEKIRTNYRNFYAGYADLEIFAPNNSRRGK